MEHKKLYHIDSHGKTRVWWAENEGGQYRTHSGILGGAIVVSDWKDAEAKNVGRSNATTVEEQALLEVQTMYRIKLESKYSEDPTKATKRNFREPALAATWDTAKMLKKKELWWYWQPKLDGFRTLLDQDGALSRSGKPFLTVQHIIDEVSAACEAENVTLDGELYNHELRDDFEEIQSLINKSKVDKITEEEWIKIRKMVQLHAYDIIIHDHPEMPQRERIVFLKDFIERHNFQTVFYVPGDFIFIDIDDLEVKHDECLEQGYEGIMFKNPSAPYTYGRSKYTQKHKLTIDKEFKVLRIEEGKGNWKGCAKAAWVLTDRGTEAKVSIRGTKERNKYVLENQHLFIGGDATVLFQGYTADNMLRFGRIKAFYEGKRDY